MSPLFKRERIALLTAGIALGSVLTTMVGAAFLGSTVFRDVPQGHFADEAIGEMYELGIIKGLDATRFGPNEPVTRAQIAVLFKRLRDDLTGKGNVVSSRSSSRVSSSRSSSSTSSSSASSTSSSSSSSSSSTSQGYNPGGYVRFDANGYNVEKNISTGEVTILIVRTGGNQGSGTVDYAFSGATAVSGKDFTPVSGTLSFANKETSKKVKMKILNNSENTTTRTVTLTLSRPTGSVLLGTPPSVTLNINNPGTSSSSSSGVISSSAPSAATTVSLSAAGYGVAENGGGITITVTRKGVTTGTTDVDYSTGNGSGQAGSEYSATSGKLTFAAGETSKTFIVSVADNSSIDGNRTFSVNISNPTGGAALETSTAVVTINDNEAGPTTGSGSLKFSAAVYQLTEGQFQARITVNHVGGFIPVNVNYATSNGSALSGSDYTATSGTLSFARGETSKIFIVPVYKDTLSELEETVTLTLSSPTAGVTLADPSIATMKISD